MKQHEAVIKVMEENGGYATFSQLYQDVLKVKDCKWKTKTPYASIRRIVQDPRFFFKINPGLWALKSHKKKVLEKFKIASKSKKKEEAFNHSYYQGLLVELGNIEGFDTFVPNQDKNKLFLSQPLKDIAKLDNVFDFTYPKIVNRARTVDVIWFNNRKLPYSFFEVEHTTPMHNSLLKFADLQDFYAKFWIVSPSHRNKEFNIKINNPSFKDIKSRIEFLNYDDLSRLHTKSFELFELKKRGVRL